MKCDHKFDECVCINCGLKTEHEFGCIEEYIVCINCGLERDPIRTPERVSFYKKERPKQSDLTAIKQLTDLWLDPDVLSTAYEMYQKVFENKIYWSKMQKVILCVCVCGILETYGNLEDTAFLKLFPYQRKRL
jgi:hypothetical protein